MSDRHNRDRRFLAEIRVVDRPELLVMLRNKKLLQWRRIAINRELDRRDRLARLVLIGKS